ncbi:hypothetical protein M438DRAFT_401428 [Aureobasidium pullulans EXF-150]|uniref:Peroxisome assembly protein 12 n=1 Tax=Aureobasidium pullulans EXF-150 TaxID=1043002 RepID=A0A074YQZ7_AURPU|nr:uncharacterized protein M438DRAFT_401428 [Aureobasidium pullulans EXF-150]KEQ89291.1 hypothetical protein M438DRAFT_401428 [Aureobasidium pullulans EXF-150]
MEFMTNLQSGLDEQKPSLFELLSEQQLGALIPPSLRYLLAVATHRYPRYLLRILNSFDELYAFLSLIVERHYLRTYGGGFTENFYGLKRERVLLIKGGEIPRAALGAPDQVRETLKLRNSDIWKNLAVMVALPYTKRKLDEHYDIHAASANILGPSFRGDALPDNATYRQKIFHYYKWFLRKVYPSVNAAYYFALLAFNLAYLFDTSKYHNPFFWLIGTRIRRMNPADHKVIAAAAAPAPPRPGAPPAPQSLLSPRTLTHTIYPRLLSSLKILLPTSIFALKFLEWWHASDFARQLSRKAAEGLELPAPTITGVPKPTTVASEKSGVTFASSENPDTKDEKENQQKDKPDPPISTLTSLPIFTVPPPPPDSSSLCPICLSAIQTPTAAQTGYVYCYTCIFRWMEGEHPRQVAFMEGSPSAGEEEGWVEENGGSRQGKWEDGRGRCAVTGRRLLGGTGGLRRVMV